MNNTIPQPQPPVTWPPLIALERSIDDLASDTSRRVAMLELALIDRRLRRQLRREIRQGQSDFSWASQDPVWVRAEAVNNAWLCRGAR